MHHALHALAALFLLTTGLLAQTDREIFLQAIAMVENPTETTRPGRQGELGAHQFTLSTWRQHSNLPFSYALKREYSDAVARVHYAWICQQLARHHVPVTDFNIAKAWNMGVTAVVQRRKAGSYPQRVVNLCRSLSTGALVLSRHGS